MSTKSSPLRFPVLTHLDIAGYQLFPGLPARLRRPVGLKQDFPPGVSVIVGINGLGKTTLLNILFRLLGGPTDWKSRTVDEPAGSTPLTLGDWKTPYYFRSRVGDDAATASCSASLTFGNRRLEITRKLQDLSIERMTVDGVAANEPSEPQYREAVCSLAGVTSFEDFFVVLRYLVFVLEERQPIVWDADAQLDVLRILFFDPHGAQETRRYFDEIQRADSRYRNIRHTARRLERELSKAREAASGDPGVLAEFRAFQTKADALASQEKQLDRQLTDTDVRRRSQRLRLEQAKYTLEEKRQAYSFAEQEHFATIFPGIGNVAEYVFVRAGGGCLVCGEQTGAAEEHIRERVAAGRCPLCNSAHAIQKPNSQAKQAVKALEQLDDQVSTAMKNVHALEEGSAKAAAEYSAVLGRALEVRSQLSDTIAELEGLGVRLPPTAEQLEELDAGVKELHREMRRWEKRQKQAEVAFGALLESGERRIQDIHRKIAKRFSHFVHDFIAETCDIQYETERRRIGQEGEMFSFPRFVVRLTSAVSPDKPIPRRTPSEVSESQREFIDLSFRMALMEVAAERSSLMLVLETPEASLDALFVARAGKLLGDFSLANPGNRVIATSNLTKGDMIAALLGAIGPDGRVEGASSLRHHVPIASREARVLDLLHTAAPNAALRENAVHYERDLQAALYPDKPVTPTRKGRKQ